MKIFFGGSHDLSLVLRQEFHQFYRENRYLDCWYASQKPASMKLPLVWLSYANMPYNESLKKNRLPHFMALKMMSVTFSKGIFAKEIGEPEFL